jgi:hypothetical protein
VSEKSQLQLEAQINALNLLLQDVYANMYAMQPQNMAPAKAGIINTVKFNWRLPEGVTEAHADHTLKLQPLVVGEIERFFSNVTEVMASFQHHK